MNLHITPSFNIDRLCKTAPVLFFLFTWILTTWRFDINIIKDMNVCIKGWKLASAWNYKTFFIFSAWPKVIIHIHRLYCDMIHVTIFIILNIFVKGYCLIFLHLWVFETVTFHLILLIQIFVHVEIFLLILTACI